MREHPRYAAMQEKWDAEAEERGYREYPMMVYPGAKDQRKPYGADGKRLKGLVVQNEDERDRALGLGQYAQAAPAAVVDDGGVQRLSNPEDERLALIAKAEQLGVQIDKRWGAARIQDAIDEAEKTWQKEII